MDLVEHANIYMEDVVIVPNKVGLVQRVPWESDDEDTKPTKQNKKETKNETLFEIFLPDSAGIVCIDSDGEERADEEMHFVDKESDEESEKEDKKLEGNNIEVFWFPEGETLIESSDNVKVVDRKFLEGDTVTLASQQNPQLGRVMGVTKMLDVWFNDSSVQYFVPSNLFYPVCRIRQDVKVVLGDWVGEIIACTFDIEVQFSDERACLIEEADYNDLVENDTRYYSDVEFHPGQKVFVKKNLLKKVVWLHGGYIEISELGEEGTVVNVVPHNIHVEWIESFMWDSSLDTPNPPPNLIPNKDLLLFDEFESSKWSVGDYVIADKIVKNGLWKDLQPSYSTDNSTTNNTNNNNKINNTNNDNDINAINSHTDTNKTSDSNNNTINNNNNNNNTNNNNLNNNNNSNIFNHDKNSNTMIDNRRKSPLYDKESILTHTCIIVCTHSFYNVLWQDGKRTIHPSTDLIPAPHLSETDFIPEDWVFESNQPYPRAGYIYSVHSIDRMCSVVWVGKFAKTDGIGRSEFVTDPLLVQEADLTVYNLTLYDLDMSIGDLVVKLGRKENANRTSWIGQILGFENGLVVVLWGDNTKEKTLIHNLTKILELDDVSDNENHEDENNQFEIDNENIEMKITPRTTQTSSWENNHKSILSAGKASISILEDDGMRERQAPPTADFGQESELSSFAVLEKCDENHFFLNKEKTGVNRTFISRVMKEWNILCCSLPEGIFVRVFEDRLDLIKFLIVGPKGTPYWDAVFLFDLYLPPYYPLKPPLVHYYSIGGRASPNLYEDGTVCLSILGTWEGHDDEKWQENNSTILQVLVSIFGLVIGNRFPYFLEPGYEKHMASKAGLINSQKYNERVYLVSLYIIHHYLKTPPFPFEKIVKNHFEKSKHNIIQRSHAFFGEGNFTSSLTENNNNNNNNNYIDEEKFISQPSVSFLKSLKPILSQIETLSES